MAAGARRTSFKPDIVHLNNYVHAALPFRAPKLVVGHSCVLSWWRAVKREAGAERMELVPVTRSQQACKRPTW